MPLPGSSLPGSLPSYTVAVDDPTGLSTDPNAQAKALDINQLRSDLLALATGLFPSGVFNAAAAAAAASASAVAGHAGAGDPHPQYMTQAESDARYPLLGTMHTRSKSIVLLNPTGVFPLTPIPIWRVPYAISVVAIYAYRSGGASATINVRKVVGATPTLMLALDYSVPAGPPWGAAGALVGGSGSMSAGDSLEILFQQAVGSPNELAVQVDYTEPAVA